MANYYNDMYLIDKENESVFLNMRKKELNIVEKIGLEQILVDFIKDYECTSYGEIYTNNDFKDYVRYLENGVDILDGVTDTYIFDCYAIGTVFMTVNGIALMTVADLSTLPDYESGDEYELIRNNDIWSDCDIRLIRLGGF